MHAIRLAALHRAAIGMTDRHTVRERQPQMP
jgi:hypothetical protein